jgi:hypothetical protein
VNRHPPVKWISRGDIPARRHRSYLWDPDPRQTIRQRLDRGNGTYEHCRLCALRCMAGSPKVAMARACSQRSRSPTFTLLRRNRITPWDGPSRGVAGLGGPL